MTVEVETVPLLCSHLMCFDAYLLKHLVSMYNAPLFSLKMYSLFVFKLFVKSINIALVLTYSCCCFCVLYWLTLFLI